MGFNNDNKIWHGRPNTDTQLATRHNLDELANEYFSKFLKMYFIEKDTGEIKALKLEISKEHKSVSMEFYVNYETYHYYFGSLQPNIFNMELAKSKMCHHLYITTTEQFPGTDIKENYQYHFHLCM